MLFALILVSVGLAAGAQLLLKHGVNEVTARGGALTLSVGSLRRAISNLAIWGGLLTFGLSAAVWIVVLSRASLSFAYPFVSITYVLILVFDRVVLRQPVSGLRWLGVALIISGIVLVSRTHQTA